MAALEYVAVVVLFAFICGVVLWAMKAQRSRRPRPALNLCRREVRLRGNGGAPWRPAIRPDCADGPLAKNRHLLGAANVERPHAELSHVAERHRLDRLVEAGPRLLSGVNGIVIFLTFIGGYPR
jgi:hypothetical protein